MLENAEKRISFGEPFLIRDANMMNKPLVAIVKGRGELWSESEGEYWDQIWLQQITRPRLEFSLSTSRQIDQGVYVNRNGRYLFFRLKVLDFETISQYFDGFKQTPEEMAVKSQVEYSDLLRKIK